MTADGLIHVFADTFGRSPPDYLLKQVERLANYLGLSTLLPVTAILSDTTFREEIATIYVNILGVELSKKGCFLPA